MKPYLVIVEDPGSDKVLNVALIRAEHEQQADMEAKKLFPSFPDQDLCVYDVHELNHEYPDGWTYQD
ncbi:MAG: hypothetical protein IPP10_14195 [Candidatus Competibacteraceae bacterium]|nr:hypothetical protein [Candidatus Competibacteraceae bacterium]MBK7984605.1 hypothetical protein [Candidatus Competibacteraceae bacterium]MBK8897141.1 hypothetical protein [Candidatus Competibacteraceae bacterium]MBK8964626.1 hypothetical protein [Candidatus Competibacteraceae bacterium]MBK9952623.1 hypothetical protein [Candidatus Competibacteraceae bacterium]